MTDIETQIRDALKDPSAFTRLLDALQPAPPPAAYEMPDYVRNDPMRNIRLVRFD